MSAPIFALTIAAIFIAVAVIAGSITSLALTAASPERKRVLQTGRRTVTTTLPELPSLESDQATGGAWQTLSRLVPKSPKDMAKLRTRLVRAGFESPAAPVLYSVLELILPIPAVALSLVFLQPPTSWMAAAIVGLLMFMTPGFVIERRLAKRRQEISNGLPDALDLLVVCIEAGSGLDQAIVKTSEELAITYPILATEMRLLTSEIRAGKPRIDAFKNFAQRTKVPEVRALTSTLIQTDKFGTSVGQALRTHADEARTKRRQRAEEAAQKIGVKLVFPLVLCFFPALYAVLLGPAVIEFMHVFMHR